MKSWNILSGLVLTGALMVSPAYADDRPAGVIPLDDPALEAQEPTSIEGRVAAVEHDSGRFVLDTENGPVGLMTTPDELQGVQVGDVVRVSFLEDESD